MRTTGMVSGQLGHPAESHRDCDRAARGWQRVEILALLRQSSVLERPRHTAPDDLKSTVKDVVVEQKSPTPVEEGIHDDVKFLVTVKRGERPEEFEMYNVTKDPMELHNLYNDGITHGLQQNTLAQLLRSNVRKRLTPAAAMFSASRCVGQAACST